MTGWPAIQKPGDRRPKVSMQDMSVLLNYVIGLVQLART